MISSVAIPQIFNDQNQSCQSRTLRVGSSTCRQDYSRMTGRGGAPLIGMERDCETDLNIVKIPPPQAPSAPTHERPKGLFQSNLERDFGS
jgi:hypothetical protein